MRRRLEPSEIRTLVIAAAAVAISAGSLWVAGHRPAGPGLHRVVAATCPHWTDC